VLARPARLGRITLGVLVALAVIPAAAAAASLSSTDSAITASCSAAGESTTSFNGHVADVSGAGSTDLTATIAWGDGTSTSGAVTANGGTLDVSGGHSYGSTGIFTVETTVTAVGGTTSTASCQVLVYAGAPGGGAFVVGDLSAAGAVTFWDAQWWKLNALSGGSAPASFKGFVPNAVAAPTCPGAGGPGAAWATDPGNSTPPPAGPLPDYMAVIVSGSINKLGPVISGDATRVVVVHTNPGYEGNPGHAGTGTVVTTLTKTDCDL
jgi:hypothetical protein